MGMLIPDSIVLDVQAGTREEAIRTVGAILVEQGHVDIGYVAAMFDREDKRSTFAGNGVAIPHAAQDAKVAVTTPGVAVLQALGGVDWDGVPVYLVFGVAASPQNQGDVTGMIASRCADPMTVERMRYAATAAEIITLMGI